MDEASKLTVDQLTRSPALQLRILAGAGGLDRPVSWAHVSELENPGPWLAGNELIMTSGLAVPRSASGQRAYLELLDSAGVSALAISAYLKAPPFHRALFATADRLNLPVLEVPLSVPFIAIAQEVAASVITEIGQRLGAQLQVFGALRWIATEEPTPQELFARLERLSGYRLFMCTAQGKPLFPGVPIPEPRYLQQLSGSDMVPPRVEGGVILPVPMAGGAAGYLVALESEETSGGGTAVAQHIASVAALEVARVRHDREHARRQGAETLAELFQEGGDATASARRLTRIGIDPGVPLLVVVAKGATTRAHDNLVEHLDEENIRYLALVRQGDLCLLINDSPETMVAFDGAAGLHLGLSKPFESSQDLHLALREAQWAADSAEHAQCPLVHFGDNPLDRWLPKDPVLLGALVDHVLGSALHNDDAKGGTIVKSLFVWLERERRTDRAAQDLHIHPNTLTYRLRRFEQLTGRDLSDTSDLAETWLAMRAARYLGRI